jgi:hypothetical protein
MGRYCAIIQLRFELASSRVSLGALDTHVNIRDSTARIFVRLRMNTELPREPSLGWPIDMLRLRLVLLEEAGSPRLWRSIPEASQKQGTEGEEKPNEALNDEVACRALGYSVQSGYGCK